MCLHVLGHHLEARMPAEEIHGQMHTIQKDCSTIIDYDACTYLLNKLSSFDTPAANTSRQAFFAGQKETLKRKYI